ncbi:endo-beta-N-acetylglucosaminidase H [Pedobacter lusitanus]|uniref:endo-beta-N-acetylglucosaminidase H n=1 Tax=Pedobacter lusitanus TaxID=1503925 RepID=UPI0009E60797|nr:endo-beta-N-acetylglucosaminidase H [Pedobacter lusitanus]
MNTKFSAILKKTAITSASLVLLMASACKKDQSANSNPDQNLSGAKTEAVGQAGPLGVCYVEVNSNDMLEVGKYKLANGKQLFDIGIIFAANINYNTTTQKAELYFNPQVTSVLTNKATKIKPLQDKGIKVMLSILGNHQGAGFANFPTQAAAQEFAQQLSDAVTTYGLDGIDFDDEYSEYGNNGTGQPNSSSFVYLVTALRQLMPNKIISFYNIGPSASNLSYNGVTVGSKVNYAWNPYYGTYSAPSIPGLTKSQLGPAATDIMATSVTTATTNATKTVKDGYGVYLYYNLTSTNKATYLSSISKALYGGQATTYTP